MGKRCGVYSVLVGKSNGKIPLGITRRRWEDNIKMYHQEVGGRLWSGSNCLGIVIGGGHL